MFSCLKTRCADCRCKIPTKHSRCRKCHNKLHTKICSDCKVTNDVRYVT